MNYVQLVATLDANEHEHALQAVSRIRFRMLEGQLARAVEARKAAERKLHEHVCDENDEINQLRAENRRLLGELDLLRKTLSSTASLSSETVFNPPVPHMPSGSVQPSRSKRFPMKSSSRLRNSDLVQRALRGEPCPEPPEPGTFDPTITEDDEMLFPDSGTGRTREFPNSQALRGQKTQTAAGGPPGEV